MRTSHKCMDTNESEGHAVTIVHVLSASKDGSTWKEFMAIREIQ